MFWERSQLLGAGHLRIIARAPMAKRLIWVGGLMVLAGGLLIAVADTIFFSAFWWPRGVSPARVFRGVAAGLMGREAALHGGTQATVLGIGLHLFNATMFVLVYTLVGRRFPSLARRPFVFGPPYGLLVYGMMTYVVVPLSRIGPTRSDNAAWIVCSILFHIG